MLSSSRARNALAQLVPMYETCFPRKNNCWQCMQTRWIVVRGTLPRRSTRTIPTFPVPSCFAVPKPKIVALGRTNRGIELRRPPLPFPPLSAPNASAPLGCSRRSGARLRQPPRLRYWSSLFDSETARPAPRPRGDGSVASGLVMICSHLSAPNAEVVDCSCSTGPAMLFTRRRCSAAEGRERADGLPM